MLAARPLLPRRLWALARTLSTGATDVYPRRLGVGTVSWGDASPAHTIVQFAPTAAAVGGADAALAADIDNSKPGAVHTVYTSGGKRVVVKVPAKDATAANIRSAAVAAVGAARKLDPIVPVAFDVSNLSSPEQVEAGVQAVLLANYHFDRYLSSDSRAKQGPLLRDVVRTSPLCERTRVPASRGAAPDPPLPFDFDPLVAFL